MDRAKRACLGRACLGRAPTLDAGAGAVAMEGATRIRRGSRAASSMRRGSIDLASNGLASNGLASNGLASKPSASTSRRPGRRFAGRHSAELQFAGRGAARPGGSTRGIPYPARPSPNRVAYVLTLPVSDQWKLMKIDAHEDRRRRQQWTRLPPPNPTYGTRPIYTAFARHSNNQRVLCFLFVHRRTRRDDAPDNHRPQGRQRS